VSMRAHDVHGSSKALPDHCKRPTLLKHENYLEKEGRL
jgi:hypothetical protein